MSGIGKYKLSDALPQNEPDVKKGGKKKSPTSKTDAEQTREAQENASAKSATASARDRMVDIGRGNQQAGRQGS